MLDERGDRPKIGSCLNTEPAQRALIKFTISPNKHISAEVGGVVPIFSTEESGRWFAFHVQVWTVISVWSCMKSIGGHSWCSLLLKYHLIASRVAINLGILK